MFFIFSIFFLSGDHPIGLYGTKLRTDFGANLNFDILTKYFFRTRLYISIPRSETGRYASTFLRERDFGQSQNPVTGVIAEISKNSRHIRMQLIVVPIIASYAKMVAAIFK